FDQQDVERSRRSPRRGLWKLDDVEPLTDREEVVLEVQKGQLAPVARRELDDPDARPARRRAATGRRHQSPSVVNVGPSSARLNTGPSRQTKKRPSWQWPHSPTPQVMFRSSVTQV